MIGIVQFFIRLVLGLACLYFLALRWAVVPYLDPSVDLNLDIATVFFGNNQPSGWVRDLLLLSRFSFGVMASIYILLPSFLFFFEFQHKVLNRNIAIIVGGVMVVSFFAALVVHQIYYN